MIGNVFYNMLTMVGNRDKDPRFTELGSQVKTMLQTRQFDDLMGPKVAHVKGGSINLLKVVDLPQEDHATLIKMGFGDLLKQPVQSQGDRLTKNAINMDLEFQDSLKA